MVNAGGYVLMICNVLLPVLLGTRLSCVFEVIEGAEDFAEDASKVSELCHGAIVMRYAS